MVAQYPAYADRLHFVELLAEGGSHSVQAEASHLDSWIGSFSIPFTTVRDPDGGGMQIVRSFSARESSFVVELATLRILHRTRSPRDALAFFDAL